MLLMIVMVDRFLHWWPTSRNPHEELKGKNLSTLPIKQISLYSSRRKKNKRNKNILEQERYPRVPKKTRKIRMGKLKSEKKNGFSKKMK